MPLPASPPATAPAAAPMAVPTGPATEPTAMPEAAPPTAAPIPVSMGWEPGWSVMGSGLRLPLGGRSAVFSGWSLTVMGFLLVKGAPRLLKPSRRSPVGDWGLMKRNFLAKRDAKSTIHPRQLVL